MVSLVAFQMLIWQLFALFCVLRYDEVRWPQLASESSIVMKTASRAAKIEAEIWTSILYPAGNLPDRAASVILQLSFTDEQRRRMRVLAVKAPKGHYLTKKIKKWRNSSASAICSPF